MNKKALNILQLLGSIIVILLFYFFYYKIIKIMGISGSNKTILRFIEYFLVCLLVFFIYHNDIRVSKNRFNKSMLNSLIITIACFVFLIFVTILLNKASMYLIKKDIMYPFVNYFKEKMTINHALDIIVNCIFIPYLLCMIFILGISDVIRKNWSASIVSGLSYAIYYGLSLKTTFDVAILSSIIPGIIFLLLTYLYKTNKNIWETVIIYILYVLFGSLIISYVI